MEITSVKITEDGFFRVNERITVPDDMANRHRVMIQKWIDKGNTPDPYVGPTPLELWMGDMARSDKKLPRYAEDILDGMTNKLSVAQITLDKLQAKKTLRETKP